MALRLSLFPFNLPTVKKKKHTVYDRFRGNGPYGEILTEHNFRIYLKTTLPYHKEYYIFVDKPSTKSIVCNGQWENNNLHVYNVYICSVSKGIQ